MASDRCRKKKNDSASSSELPSLLRSFRSYKARTLFDTLITTYHTHTHHLSPQRFAQISLLPPPLDFQTAKNTMALLARSNLAMARAPIAARKFVAPRPMSGVRMQARKFDMPEMDAEEMKAKATEMATTTATFIKVRRLQALGCMWINATIVTSRAARSPLQDARSCVVRLDACARARAAGDRKLDAAAPFSQRR